MDSFVFFKEKSLDKINSLSGFLDMQKIKT